VNIKRYLTRNNIILGSAALIIIAVFLSLVIEPGTADIAAYTVKRDSFVISINQSGEMLAKNSETISVPNDVRGSLQIVYLAPEGSRIKKGDILIMFDTGEWDTRIEEREATLIQAQEELEKLKASQSSQMASLMSSLEVTRNNFKLSKIRLQQMQFEAETRKQIEELNFKNSEISLKRQEENIRNQKIINNVDMKNAELRISRAKGFLEDAKREREKLILRATMDGLVVYKENFRSQTREKIKVGDTPHPRMPLIELPDLSVMQVKTSINEIDIRKVEKGQDAVVRLDAVPDSVFTGKVTDVAYLARREKGSNVKVFDVIITIDGGENPVLKPGMSASVEIIAEQMDDKVFVPLESVFQKEGKTVAYVKSSDWQEREIEVGKSNSNYIVVEKGLDVGEEVALRDPTVKLEQFGAEIKAPPERKTTSSQGAGGQFNIEMIRDAMRGGGGGGGRQPGGGGRGER